MRTVKVLIVALSVLLSLSSVCLAADADEIVAKLGSYAQAKALAAACVAAVKEQYQEEMKAYQDGNISPDELNKLQARTKEYQKARRYYEQAAAAFEGWRAVVHLAIIDDARLPDNDAYYRLGQAAHTSCRSFTDAAHVFLATPLVTPPYAKAPPPDKNMKALMDATIFKEIIFPAVDKLLNISEKNTAIKNKKRDLLLEWLDKYLAWEAWDTPGPVHKPVTTTTTTTTTKTTTSE